MYLLPHGPCVFYTFILFGFCHIVLGDMKNPKPQALDVCTKVILQCFELQWTSYWIWVFS